MSGRRGWGRPGRGGPGAGAAAGLLLVLAAAAGGAGCGPPGAGAVQTGVADASGNRTALGAFDARGRPVFATRIDGNVTDVFRAAVFGGEDDLVVLTGFAGGEDQGSLLVFSMDGRPLAARRVEGRTPFPASLLAARAPGERHRQLQRPLPGHARLFEEGGRRFLSVGTGGWWAPHAVEILEVSGGALVPRAVIWNFGSLSHYVVDGGRLVLVGLSNRVRTEDGTRYGIGVGLVDLRGILAAPPGGEPAVISFPSDGGDGEGYAWYALLPERHGVGGSEILPPVPEGGRIRVPMERGLSYLFRPEDGSATVAAGDPSALTGGVTPGDLAKRVVLFRPR